MHPLGPRLRRVVLVVVLALGLVVLDGCTDDAGDRPSASAGDDASEEATAHVVTRVTRVVGRLPDARRQAVRLRTQEIVEGYLRRAMAQDQQSWADLPGFTEGAQDLARRHRDVLTVAGVPGLEDVQPGRSAAYVAVLAPRGRVAGATANVDLVLRVTAEGVTQPWRVGGRLLLTNTPGGLKVFGFDLHRSGAGGGA